MGREADTVTPRAATPGAVTPGAATLQAAALRAAAFQAALAAAPYRYDFYQALRRLECLYAGPDSPRWGHALRPAHERVRFGQEPDLSFAAAPLASFAVKEGQPPRLQVHLFGLFGPNGPLPLHLTEYARDRLRNADDPTFSRFLDLLHHRFLTFFYRAWAQSQPHVNRDRPAADRFTVYVGSFVGAAAESLRHRTAVADEGTFFHAGALIRHVRNAHGLQALLAHYFKVAVQVEEFVAHWMPLEPGDRTRLGAEGAALGSGAALGTRIWDRQHKFRLRIGPLSLDQYVGFLPGQPPLKELVDWVRRYLGFELDWDVQLLLRTDAVPRLQLGRQGRLGWTAWLGARRSDADADDLYLDAEAFAGRVGVSTV